MDLSPSTDPRPHALAHGVRPVLFLHIPKTAGTSLLLGLQNLFGDNRVIRLKMEDPLLHEKFDDIVSGQSGDVACVNGHLPSYLFARHMDKFFPFTVLRHPVDRVFSQYHFTRRHPPSALEQLNLRSDFTFDDFITSRAPEIFAQVHDGMTRQLCGNPRMFNTEAPEYWAIASYPEAVDQALETLEQMDFGLAEKMEVALDTLHARLSIPFDIDNPVVNVSAYSADQESMSDVLRVIRLNTLDIALYDKAVALFNARARTPVSAAGHAPAMIFAPELNVRTVVADIPGRQGFHEVEPGTYAWLRADALPRIHFHCPISAARIRLKFFCITADYPLDNIRLTLNGREIPHLAQREVDPRWCNLETESIDIDNDRNMLAIEPPSYISARLAEPGSRDERYLSLALQSVTFLG